MNQISMRGYDIRVAEAATNDIYMSLSMRMFSTRPNQNGHAVTEAFIDRIVADDKYHCLPQVADTGKLKSGNASALGHNYDPVTGTFLTDQIGAFHSFQKVNDEYGVSLLGQVRIPKRNPGICAAIREQFNQSALNVSFEILATHTRVEDNVTIIDAEDGNEIVGMAVVSIPAYPEATALALVAEQEEGVTENMEETKRIAEQEARLKIAEEQVKDTEDENEELKKKREEDERDKKAREEKEASLNSQLTEKDAQLIEKDAKIAELEARVAELTPFKAEAETLRSEKQAVELKEKQDELTRFAELHGLDAKDENIAKAIEEANYAAVLAEALKASGEQPTRKLAPYAMASGIKTSSEYGGLLDSVDQ